MLKAWLAKREAKRVRRKALGPYGGACARCLLPATEVVPRHAPELGDDLSDAASWLPLCPACRTEVEADREGLRRAGFTLTPIR